MNAILIISLITAMAGAWLLRQRSAAARPAGRPRPALQPTVWVERGPGSRPRIERRRTLRREHGSRREMVRMDGGGDRRRRCERRHAYDQWADRSRH